MAIFNTSRGDRDGTPGYTPAPSPLPQAAGGKRGMFSVIGPDVTITGNIVATADLHIDGRVDGDVDCGNLVQGNDSHINGAVKAESARLGGAIDGSVAIRQLTVERTARITGDVEYETITIETGASVDGRLKHVSAHTIGRASERAAATPEPQLDVVQFTTSEQTA